MDEKERYDKGMAKRRKVLGAAWVDRANARKNAFISNIEQPKAFTELVLNFLR